MLRKLNYKFSLSIISAAALSFFAACGGETTVDEDFQPGVTVTPPAVLELSHSASRSAVSVGEDYDFGRRILESESDITFLVKNKGERLASEMAVESFSTAFHFKGGSFPGTGGTCTTELLPGKSCTVTITFIPLEIESYSTKFTLNYKNGRLTNNADSVSKNITGEGYAVSPSILSVTPSSAAVVGGTRLTMTGNYFRSGMRVNIGGSSCTDISVASSTSFSCTAPAHAAGAVDIEIYNRENQNQLLSNALTYLEAPTISSVSPSFGPLAGGTTLTINGSYFRTSPSVTLGDVACTSVTLVSSSQITCVTPAHAAGSLTVTVTNSDGQSASLANGFTFQGAPTVTGITQSSGAVAGGDTVTLTGTNFSTGIGVTIGGVTCSSVNVVSSTQLTCVTGSHATTGQSWTATSTTTAPAVRYYQSSIWTGSKMIVFGGNSAVNTGGQFDPTTNSWTRTTTTGAPSGRYWHVAAWSGSAMIIFGGYNGTSALNTGALYDPVANTWTSMTTTGAPAIRRFSSAVWTGNKMLIWGGLGTAAATPMNTGGQYDPSTNAWTATITTGAPAARYNVAAVWTGAKYVAALGYTGSSCPNTGGVYDPIANNWTATTTTSAPTGRWSPVAVWTGSSMVALSGSNGTATNTGGVYTLATNTWTRTNTTGAPPGADNAVGAWTGARLLIFSGLAGGTLINSGGQFDPAANSWISMTTTGAPATRQLSSGVWTGTQFLVFGGTGTGTYNSGGLYTPDGPASGMSIAVSNTDGQTGSLSSAYTYRYAPQVFGVVRNAGALAGGTTVTVFGSNFFSGATVLFGGSACTSVNVMSSERISCVTPAHAAGAVDVVVTNTDAQTGTATNAFTYQAAPTVTSVSPVEGVPAGGTSITITGTGFISYATVTVGGVTCTSPSVTNSTTMTCTTGAHASGAVDVVVTNTDTQSGTGSGVYTYTPAPTITSVDKAAGPVTGGTTIVLTGTGFRNGATVSVAGANCGSLTVDSSTQITCTTSSHATLGESWITMGTTGRPNCNGGAMVWTGSKVIFAGGRNGSNNSTNEGGLFDPTTNSWTTMATPARPYYEGGAIWTGAKMLTLGANGSSNQGMLYDPVANSWSDMSTTGAPSARQYPEIAWTGKKAIVYGGYTSGVGYLNTGAIYDLNSDTWSSMPDGPEGRDTSYTMSTWSGNKMLVWGGSNNSSTRVNTGAVYDLSTNSWSDTTTTGAPVARSGHSVLWTGSKMLVLMGANTGGGQNTGGQYDPNTNSWTITSTTGAPLADFRYAYSWTGTTAFVWGGSSNTGGSYDPIANSWSQTATTSITMNTSARLVAWTGNKMIMFNVESFFNSYSGHIYTPPGTSPPSTITVTNFDAQTGSLTSSFSYQNPPQVFGVGDPTGTTAGGTTVAVIGSGFASGASVTFGGSACTSVNVQTSTQLTCVTPAHAAGAVDVVVTNADAQSATGTGVFTYQ